ncbi:MAG: AraC family transcriptional regulator CmrA [Archangium gephyra]|uniref:AraC family transcriptional regulator CmrA n=1 Tax=Archangium gephyra TaxID=48 RepID=A0A2W5SZ38_9BACT|nr:MAG: AraC family transcriptional regulator CmrA [Archangium gephyra]
MNALLELRAVTRRLTEHRGTFATALPGVILIRGDAPSAPTPVLYAPRVCIGIEGLKELAVGERLVTYGPGEELVASLTLPVTGRITVAPYTAFTMELDPVEIAEMALSVPPRESSDAGFISGPACPQLLDAVLRAVRMLENPEEIPTLGPLVRKEILFRVLNGPHGSMLRRIILKEGYVAQIARAVTWIREHYTERLHVDAVARRVGMSPTSFHRHFKAVTAMSPLQYQKQLRLQEARHLLLAEAIDVGTASSRVGYESPTQFTREFARAFGAPPRRDAERMRASMTAA